MNRTERLYAIVEQLRAQAPHSVTAQRLAQAFSTSVRTIERDVSALQHAGVPIWARTGPGGGYAIDARHTLAPLAFTAEEALTVIAALRSAPVVAAAAETALRKLLAVLPDTDRARAEGALAPVPVVPAVPVAANPATSMESTTSAALTAVPELGAPRTAADVEFDDASIVPQQR